MTDKPQKHKKQDAQDTQEAQQNFIMQQKPKEQDERRAKRLEAIQAALDPERPEYRPEMAEALQKAVSSITNALTDLQPAADLLHEIEDLEPFIIAELAKDPGSITLDEYLDNYTAGQLLDMMQDPENTFAKALAAARNTQERQQSKRPDKLMLPMDKINSQIAFADWLDSERQLDGQTGMFIVKMEPDGYPKQLNFYYAVNFPAELEEVEKKLTPFDRRIYNATYWLQQVNGSDMTFTQIFRAAGLGETPNEKQLDRLKRSVDKMRFTGITWNNIEEAAEFKTNNTWKTYDGYLYPVELVTERKLFNGKIAEVYVRSLRPLPLLEFAKERKQVATIPAAILQSKLPATDTNLALEDYIIKRIEQEKRAEADKKQARRQVKILYETLYKNIGATARQKQRTALKNLYKYLDELKTKGYIKDFCEEKTKSTGSLGVLISF